jgi:hypothetical protein
MKIGSRVPRGRTVAQIAKDAGVRMAETSTLPLSARATPKERAVARESLKRRCPYLFTKSRKGKS